MNRPPNLILLSLLWAFALALVMTAIGALTEGRPMRPQAEALTMAHILWMFLAWFVSAATLILFGSLIYLVTTRIRGRTRTGG